MTGLDGGERSRPACLASISLADAPNSRTLALIALRKPWNCC
jgi:hypothetical protein